MEKQTLIHFLDSARGIYIPRDFAQMIDPTQWENIAQDDLDVLKTGPESESYWEVWTDILDNAETKDDGYKLYQDGDLWLVNYESAIAQLNEFIQEDVEYNETHEDAGNNYAFMTGDQLTHDATKDDSFPALTEAMRKEYMVKDESESLGHKWLKKYDIDTKGIDSDILANLALECFEMTPGSIWGPYEDDESFPIASFPLQEHCIDISESGIDGLLLDFISESCEAYIDGHTAYVVTDSVWFAMVPVKEFQALINEHAANEKDS